MGVGVVENPAAAQSVAESTPQVEAVKRPVEVVKRDITAIGLAAIRKRNEGLDNTKRKDDSLAGLRELPDIPIFVDQQKQPRKISVANIHFNGRGLDAAGNMQNAVGNVTAIVGRKGDMLTLEIEGQQSPLDVPIAIVEVAALAGEADTLLSQFSDAQRQLLNVMIKDYKGEEVSHDGLDDKIMEVGRELGLADTKTVQAELSALRGSTPEVQQAADSEAQQLEGRLVVDPEDRQAAIDRIKAVEEDAKTKSMTIDHMRGFIGGLKAEDMHLPKGISETAAREKALAALNARGEFNAASVMAAFAEVGISEDGFNLQAAELGRSISEAKKNVVALNNKVNELRKNTTVLQTEAGKAEFQAAQQAFQEASANLNIMAREQIMYQEVAKLFSKGAMPVREVVQKLIDGKLPQEKTSEVVKAFSTGDVEPLVLELTNDLVAKHPDVDMATLALQRDALIAEWKKKGKTGGILALAALLMTLTSVLQGVTGTAR